MKRSLLFLLLGMLSVAPQVRGQWAERTVRALELKAVTPLVVGLAVASMENALLCKRKLGELAQSQQEPARGATEQLSWLVHHLFYCEIVVHTAKKNMVAAEAKAKQKDGMAAAAQKPNALGHKDKSGHDNAVREAKRFRTDAQRAVNEARDSMLQMVQTTDAACQSYRDQGYERLASLLEDARITVVGRCLQNNDFTAWQTGRFNHELMAGLAAVGLEMTGKKGSRLLYKPRKTEKAAK
ncbi:MAG: hypothetical protein JWO89_1771 [Verrucomicrobiaceae bacterium]|nr:hypothetical protein [Verrucomicrobiaceae bacterium]